MRTQTKTNKLNKRWYPVYGKRVLDVFGVVLLAVPATLLISLAALAIWLETRETPFFIQIRPGLNGRPFKLYKLRSMISQTERNGKALSDIERITKSGRIIRALSVDELPQLINILKGDMSFIGPRPLLMDYLPLYSIEQARRHEVRPGVSGWAQVNGRNAISWEQKFKLDVWYVDNVSLGLDMKIIWKTLINIFKRKDINADSGTTMDIFTGNNED